MTQEEKRIFLIRRLIAEEPQYRGLRIPNDEEGQKRLLRSLMNVRPPRPIGEEFLTVQDEYLQAETAAKGVTELADLTPAEPGIYLWQGDITTLKCGAIVNAANSGMTGCYVPCHGCIDNVIHTYAGVQLRLACASLMEEQGHEEPAGQAKLTPAYNLPCDYVLHTVGPIVFPYERDAGGPLPVFPGKKGSGDAPLAFGGVTQNDRELLASCYRSCLELAQRHGIRSVAFCCISTGEFHFPNQPAAEIAVRTVREYRGDTEVIFNVFKDIDYEIYRELLG